MKDFTDQDIERIEALVDTADTEKARAEMRELHPADIAELFRSLNLREAEWLFNLIDDKEQKADVLMELDEEDRKKLLENMDPEQIGHFIDLLDTDDADDSVFAQTKARLPWLLIGIVGGIVNSLILGGFEAQIAAVTALAIFIPLIGGTGGNVGVQASAIVVQGLANGRLDIKEAWRQVGRSVLIALINAVVISAVIFAYCFFTQPGDYAVMMAVAVSLFAVVIFATVFGTLVPLTLERLKVNPALATGPFIQITNDVVGLLIYVGMATWMLKVFPS